jgi:hypothetical protein
MTPWHLLHYRNLGTIKKGRLDRWWGAPVAPEPEPLSPGAAFLFGARPSRDGFYEDAMNTFRESTIGKSLMFAVTYDDREPPICGSIMPRRLTMSVSLAQSPGSNTSKARCRPARSPGSSASGSRRNPSVQNRADEEANSIDPPFRRTSVFKVRQMVRLNQLGISDPSTSTASITHAG